jgi:hypothetical protein
MVAPAPELYFQLPRALHVSLLSVQFFYTTHILPLRHTTVLGGKLVI